MALQLGARVSLCGIALPWDDSTKWEFGLWYPCAMSHDIEYLGEEFTVVVHSWDLATLRFEPGHKLFGDITTLGLDVSFIDAVKIANQHNKKKIFTASWIKEAWAQEVWP